MLARVDLKDIKTYILHKHTNVARKEHLTRLLTSLGMDFEFVEAYDMGDHSLQSATLTLMNLFSSLLEKDVFQPVLVLEDDVNITQWFESTQIDVPADADACYLGVSSCSAVINNECSTVGIQYDRCEDHPQWVRLYNMLSLHAFLVMSRRWMLQLLRCMMVANVYDMHFDMPVARTMYLHKVYAAHAPLFCQDASLGGNEEYTRLTFDQIPRLTFTISSPYTTIKHEPKYYDLKRKSHKNNMI
jgi:hypothetical protein